MTDMINLTGSSLSQNEVAPVGIVGTSVFLWCCFQHKRCSYIIKDSTLKIPRVHVLQRQNKDASVTSEDRQSSFVTQGMWSHSEKEWTLKEVGNKSAELMQFSPGCWLPLISTLCLHSNGILLVHGHRDENLASQPLFVRQCCHVMKFQPMGVRCDASTSELFLHFHTW